MQKKLTITVDEEVYEGLHKIIGPAQDKQVRSGTGSAARGAPQFRVGLRRNGKRQEAGEGSHGVG